MNDRAFRLDFFIAIAALVVSILTTATLVYQTHVIQEQYSATIWPYLTVATTNNPNGSAVGRTIQLQNEGLGPALVRSAQLNVDGKTISSWNALEHVLRRDPLAKLAIKGSQYSSAESTVDASTILRPGESQTIFSVKLPKGVPMKLLLRHPLTMNICYCSINNSCWKLHMTPGVMSSNYPQPTSSCPIGATINSYVE
jgi:hypothetical protein